MTLSTRLTPMKYADSPGPAADDPSLYFAYGGPHARVSSPRVGCSILITSALFIGHVKPGMGL